MNYIVSFHFQTYISIKQTNVMENFNIVMGGIINIGGLHTVIPGFYFKPIILVFMILLLVIINSLYILECCKLTEIKLKVIL